MLRFVCMFARVLFGVDVFIVAYWILMICLAWLVWGFCCLVVWFAFG